jgi:ABC-type amino acid transport substrate-binding protein
VVCTNGEQYNNAENYKELNLLQQRTNKQNRPGINLTVNDTPEFNQNMKILQKAFRQKKICVETNTLNSEFVKEYFENSAIKHYGTFHQVIHDIQYKRCDLTFSTQYDEKLLKSNTAKVGPLFYNGIPKDQVAVGFRKDDHGLHKKFNKAITEAIEDSTVRELAIQWFESEK